MQMKMFRVLVGNNHSYTNSYVVSDEVTGVGAIIDPAGDIDKIYNYVENRNIKLTYLTIHKSKGLECDNVIIINLIDSYLGFPSKIKEEQILRLVSNNVNNYPYSEERRLFYVGLTRTKNYVYLLVPYRNKSVFVEELFSYKSKNIENI